MIEIGFSLLIILTLFKKKFSLWYLFLYEIWLLPTEFQISIIILRLGFCITTSFNFYRALIVWNVKSFGDRSVIIKESYIKKQQLLIFNNNPLYYKNNYFFKLELSMKSNAKNYFWFLKFGYGRGFSNLLFDMWKNKNNRQYKNVKKHSQNFINYALIMKLIQ